MTEERFTTDNGSHEDVCLVDNLTGKEYESNFNDIVDLMNDISEENENSKARFYRERDIAMELGRECDTLFIKNRELEKENEELKQYKQSVKTILQHWSQKQLTAKQLMVVIAIMEELNVYGDDE